MIGVPPTPDRVFGGAILRELFVTSAEAFSNRPALVIGARAYSYEELEILARRWAARLMDQEQRPRRVGVLADRSEVAYCGILAAALCGAAFVPMTPRLPTERLQRMLRVANLDALIVDERSRNRLPELLRASDVPVLLLPESPSSAVGAADRDVIDCESLSRAAPIRDLPSVSPNDVAYLLFTSGTTGLPKGVPITQFNAAAFFAHNLAHYSLDHEDQLSQTFELTFDLAMFDLFMAWGSGACVHVARPIDLLAPIEYARSRELTVWFSVPAIANELCRRGLLRAGVLPRLKWSLFCGEPLPCSTAALWHASAANSTVENLYGPTELTIACSRYRWEPGNGACERGSIVPIGRIYPGHREVVLDEEFVPVRDGVAGELCIAGPQMSPGYWLDDSANAAKYLTRSDVDGHTRMYFRTGDLVVLRDGEYHYRGRIDHQVKVRGHRIELLEVESALRENGAVDAIALPWPASEQPDYLVAAVTGVAPESVPGMVAALQSQLPRYMVPRQVFTLDALPLSPSGKIDRSALRAVLLKLASTHTHTSIGGSDVDALVAEVLGIPLADVTDDLEYQQVSAWDSLAHTRLVTALEEHLGIALPETALVDLRSVRAIREIVAQCPGSRASEAAIVRPPPLRVHRGLTDVYVDRTSISDIDGDAGQLSYRGYSIDDLVDAVEFEDVVHLLVRGDLPSQQQLEETRRELTLGSVLPREVLRLVELLRTAHPLDALRCAISCLGALEPSTESHGSAEQAGLRLIGAVPSIVAYHAASGNRRDGAPASCARRIFGICASRIAPEKALAALNRVLVLQAEHGSNASSFAVRVAVGTRTSLAGAITAAIATFSGELHGGAAEQVLRMVREIGESSRAEEYVRARLRNNLPVYGFGHRVYRVEDPRVRHLRRTAHELASAVGGSSDLEVIESVARAVEPLARRGLVANVDLYTGVVLNTLGLPEALVGAVFAAGRVAGWVAHALEQQASNILIRPRLSYVGAKHRRLSRRVLPASALSILPGDARDER